jgi:non-ribosomal peptide synthase protein (TIGR01720 family)
MKLRKRTDLRSTVLAIHESMKSVPHKGFGYSLLKYLKKSKDLPVHTSDILFNHLGTFGTDDSDLVKDWDFISDEPTGMPIGTGGLRTHVLDINSNIMSNRLCVSFGFSTNLHQENQIEALSLAFKENLLDSVQDVRLLFSPTTARRHRSLSPLVMLHPVDGNVGGLTALGAALERPYLVLSYPEPSERRGKEFSDMSEMAEFQIRELQKIYPRGPYILIGYSFGALLAYEMVLQLLARQTPVEAFVVLDQATFSPADRFNRLPSDINAYGQFLISLIGNSSRITFTEEEKDVLLKQTPPEVVPEIPKRISEGMSEVQKEFVRHRLEIYKNCSQVLNSYPMDVTTSTLGIPILVLTANSAEERQEDLGWRAFTSGKVESRHINTNHYDLLGKDSLPQVVTSLANYFTSKKERRRRRSLIQEFEVRSDDSTQEAVRPETEKTKVKATAVKKETTSTTTTTTTTKPKVEVKPATGTQTTTTTTGTTRTPTTTSTQTPSTSAPTTATTTTQTTSTSAPTTTTTTATQTTSTSAPTTTTTTTSTASTHVPTTGSPTATTTGTSRTPAPTTQASTTTTRPQSLPTQSLEASPTSAGSLPARTGGVNATPKEAPTAAEGGSSLPKLAVVVAGLALLVGGYFYYKKQ